MTIAKKNKTSFFFTLSWYGHFNLNMHAKLRMQKLDLPVEINST